MGQIYKISRVSGTVVELSDGQKVSTNDDFFKEDQLVFLLKQNSVVGDGLRKTLRLRYGSYLKMSNGLYRVTKDVAVRTPVLVPLHIKDKATGIFHVPSETSEFDFLSLLGVELPEVALDKYTFDVLPEVVSVASDYSDTVNPDRSFVSDEELFGVGATVLGMTPIAVVDTASDYYDSGISSPSAWSEENEEVGGK